MPSTPDAPRPDDSDPGLDIDAAFADIVAHWEPSVPSALEGDVADPFAEQLEEARPEQPRREQPRREQPEEPRDDEEDHFIPPPPPPLPKVEPRRKLAWVGLFGAPALGLVLLV